MGRRPYRILEADDNCIELALRPPMTAGKLLEELGFSRPGRAQVFARRRLTCEGKALAHGDHLGSGDIVTLELEAADPAWPDCAPADVLWEDPYGLALVANKPQGQLVHGDGTDSGEPTLSDAVQAHLADEGRIRCAQAVQRIDTGTSGCVLFSLTEEFQPAFDAEVADGSVDKRYLLVVRGRPRWADSPVEAPIGRDRHDARRMHAGSGKPARTLFTTLETREVPGQGELSLVEAKIETGRRHQIRVHAASVGFPVLGDALYGGLHWNDGLMLHAALESFAHPLTRERITVEAPVPERFKKLFG